MECDEFLQSFSDFLDAEFEKHSPEEYNGHLEKCARCGEYDRVVRRGLRLVREMDVPEPVPDFMPRLQRSFLSRRERSEVIVQYAKAAGMAGFAIAALLLLAVNPNFLPAGDDLELPPVVVEAETLGGRSHSLWGPPPRFSVSASFLTAPGPTSEGSLLRRPLERFSLFREPVRTSFRGTVGGRGSDGAESESAKTAAE
jgi:hypothetical protein